MGTMSPVSSARGMKDIGGSRPRWGCSQRTNASTPTTSPGGEADDRLVEDAQLVALDGPVQGAFDVETLHRLGPHVLVEELEAGPALRLGPVHGGVRIPNQRLGRVGSRPHGHADAHAEEHLLSVDQERGLEGVGDALGHAPRLPAGGGVLAHDHELVAPEAGHGVLGPYGLAEPLGHRDQQGVPGGVAPAVVEDLEAVEVDEQHRHPGTAPGGPGQGLVQPVGEQGPIGEAGEGVVERLVGQFVLRLMGQVGLDPPPERGRAPGHTPQNS